MQYQKESTDMYTSHANLFTRQLSNCEMQCAFRGFQIRQSAILVL